MLTSPLRISTGAAIPIINEAIKLRLPFSIPDPGLLTTSSSSSPLPLAPGVANYHTAFIKSFRTNPAAKCLDLEVWIAPAFTRYASNGRSSIDLFMSWPENTRRRYLPLPAQSHQRTATPAGFGRPLEVGGWVDEKPAWLGVVAEVVRLPFDKPFKRYVPSAFLSVEEALRIEIYAKELQLLTKNHNKLRESKSPSHPRPQKHPAPLSTTRPPQGKNNDSPPTGTAREIDTIAHDENDGVNSESETKNRGIRQHPDPTRVFFRRYNELRNRIRWK